MNKVICLGDSCVDLIIPYQKEKESFIKCGGSAANSAYSLAKLNVETLFVGKAGNDSYGLQMKEELNKANVNTQYFLLDENLSSTKIEVRLDDQNERHPTLVSEGSSTYLQIFEEELNQIDLSDVKYLLTNGMMLFQKPAAETIINFLNKVHKLGIKILLDINYRKETINQDNHYLKQAIKLADYLLGSMDDDFLPLTNSQNLEEVLKKLDKNKVTILRQASGSYLVYQDKINFAPSYKVKVVDTLGAGDNHSAGFIYALVNGYDLEMANKIACLNASFSVQEEGARSSATETRLLEELNKS